MLEQTKRLLVPIVFERFYASNDQRFRFGQLLAEIVQAADLGQLLLGSLLTAGNPQRDAKIVMGLFEIGFESDGVLEVLNCASYIAISLFISRQVAG